MPSHKPNKSIEKSNRKSSRKAPEAETNPAEPMNDNGGGGTESPSTAKKGAGNRKRGSSAKSARR